MWSALENIALRESLPSPLTPGESVRGILVAGQLDRGRHNLHHLGRKDSRPYLLKQFYSLDTHAFLRWQNEARFASLPQSGGYTWPTGEWRGGLIAPFPEGDPLHAWGTNRRPSPQARLRTAAILARRIADLHARGIVHRGLSPAALFIGDTNVAIGDFGCARHARWDDLWADIGPPPGHPGCTSPESLRGEHGGSQEDVHAFGALLHLLLTDTLPFSSMKQAMRTYIPGLVRPGRLTQANRIPPFVEELAHACTSPAPADRPTMAEAVSILAGFSDQPETPLPPPHARYGTTGPRQKVMVFIKSNDRAASLFEAALAMADSTPSLFLFVGLIPGNLPCGHTERYKGGLFRKLAQGLILCRSAGLDWSLRVLDNVDPEKTARHFIRQYRPDRILLGEPEKRPADKGRFRAKLAPEDIPIDSIA